MKQDIETTLLYYRWSKEINKDSLSFFNLEKNILDSRRYTTYDISFQLNEIRLNYSVSYYDNYESHKNDIFIKSEEFIYYLEKLNLINQSTFEFYYNIGFFNNKKEMISFSGGKAIYNSDNKVIKLDNEAIINYIKTANGYIIIEPKINIDKFKFNEIDEIIPKIIIPSKNLKLYKEDNKIVKFFKRLFD